MEYKTEYLQFLFNFHTSQPMWEEIDNQRVDHFVLSRWLVNYAIMSQPVGEIRISGYFSRKNVTFRKMSLYQ